MGRIAPRRRKTTPVYPLLLRTWSNLSQRLKPGTAREVPETPDEADVQQPAPNGKRQQWKAWWLKVWHLPDNFHWMAPLPYVHRRWVIVFGTILLLSLLWPYSDDRAPRQPPATQQENNIPLQAELMGNSAQQTTAQPTNGHWQRYQIKAGQTLAQLFRDNNLPVNDVFAMAQVEGSDKPLSNLKAGQEVRIERAANGAIVALSVTMADNREALFRRQADGSYRRLR
ncbi:MULTISPECIES: OapA family protein [unclassified Serratia (in: enterobacteria)]|uniref:OapA family protein n=1 Tax=unclassified Serratia (in: enterobacteria) TaxID=2647522 RepID=UPI000502990F|nr:MULTISPECIES: LysM-like peptidoglycan-binding domain-containing protein [unclassified Serratia (in: enterobacteria)]KFK91847.1 Opacity-associated protein A domain protein [Serratia sp. Ag2]KFK95491.1 Opacity-associated protein A domain protein [Serratia sp. Ag1]